MYAIIGLGNPGRKYVNTRHNIGFEVVDLLAQRNNILVNKIKFKSVYGEGRIGDEKVLIVKPQTFMNNSGIAVLDLYNYYKLPIENILVVLDDVDIQFGTIRIKSKGSGGTHNGLKSIIYQLQRDDFPRVKVGIGKPENEKMDLADFVLGKFSEDDRQVIQPTIEKTCEAIETIIIDDISTAMNIFNSRNNRAQE